MGQKAKFKRVNVSKPEFFGFIDDEDFESETLSEIYDLDYRDSMLENGEINANEFGFMKGWDEALDEPFAE